jgi:hypothetical protein
MGYLNSAGYLSRDYLKGFDWHSAQEETVVKMPAVTNAEPVKATPDFWKANERAAYARHDRNDALDAERNENS